MSRMSSSDYQKMLDAAGDEAERQAASDLAQAEVDERLHALEAGGFPLDEVEQAAATSEGPKTRESDGKVYGIDQRRPLTPAQVQFARNVIQGMSRREAYRNAYPNAKGSDATISACAHRLSKDERVARIITAGWDETEEALAEDIAAQRRYVARSLVALSKAGKQEGTRIRALELLGRAAGMFKDQQQQADKPLTADELRKELAGHLRLVAGKA